MKKYLISIACIFILVACNTAIERKPEISIHPQLYKNISNFNKEMNSNEYSYVMLHELKYDTLKYFIYSSNGLCTGGNEFNILFDTLIENRVSFFGIRDHSFLFSNNIRYIEKYSMNTRGTVPTRTMNCTFVGDSLTDLLVVNN